MIKSKFDLFIMRLKACYQILRNKPKHWMLVSIDHQNLIELFKEEDFEVDVLYHGLRPYVIDRIIQQMAEGKDDIDMALDKAQFQAMADDYIKTGKMPPSNI